MLKDLFVVPQGVKSRRQSSFDRTGGNADRAVIPAGKTFTMADIAGAGVIRHIWITISCKDPMIRRNLVLRMYWDGAEHPSVESPIGDFFGQGFGENYNFAALPLAAAPKEGRALNSYFPMPFRKAARITVENQSDVQVDSFYYYCDYEEHSSLPDDALYFHAWWNRELTVPADGAENEWSVLGPEAKNQGNAHNYLFADITGRGKFVGVNYYVQSPSPMWYGEGDDMFQVDGEPYPYSLHGTGTEDFFNSSWCPKEPYAHPYFGYARVNGGESGWLGRTHCYRFMLEEPVYFRKSLNASIEHGHANCLTLDLSSVAYWYQTLPNKPFSPMRPKDQRQNLPSIGAREILVWRDAWRKSMGGGGLWGNETK